VFFSSHILSDAEALCSQFGIVAQGRLMALGRLADMVAFELRGWEMVVANLPETTKARLHGRASLTALSNQRYTIELPAHEAPDQLIQTLAADGVEVVSLNPIRATLEDYFVSMVNAASPRESGGTERR
jgi:ABC-2 type transport system ATP-binding protein